MRRYALVAVLAGLAMGLGPAPAQRARAQNKPSAWIELRTPHFLVISNGKEKQARHVGLQLEQIRAALAQSFPGFRTWEPSDMVVLALKDEATMQALVAQRGKAPDLPAGVFLGARERTCILLRLDEDHASYHPAFHEYVHALLAYNFPHLPLWLAEGLAELYANTQFDAHRALVGDDGWQTPYLRNRLLLPLYALRAALPASHLYRDPERSQLFYAESWALTHFLLLGPGMGRGAKLSHYLARLQLGDDEAATFQQTFGSLPELQGRLEQFRRSFTPAALQLKDLPAWDEKSFELRPLPDEEWAAVASALDLPNRFPHTGFASSRP